LTAPEVPFFKKLSLKFFFQKKTKKQNQNNPPFSSWLKLNDRILFFGGSESSFFKMMVFEVPFSKKFSLFFLFLNRVKESFFQRTKGRRKKSTHLNSNLFAIRKTSHSLTLFSFCFESFFKKKKRELLEIV